MKKVKQPRREKTVILDEKQLKQTTGSSGYMVSWGFDEEQPDPNNPYGGG